MIYAEMVTFYRPSLRVGVPSPRGKTGGRGRSLPPVFPRGRVRLHVGYYRPQLQRGYANSTAAKKRPKTKG